MEKEKVILKIKKYCKEFGVKEPDFNDYNSVKECADILNKTCIFCKKYKGKYMGVICRCEVDNFTHWEA